MDELARAVDAVLADTLPPKLRASIDAALAAGCDRREVLARVRAGCGGRRGVALAVEAYLGCGQEG